MKAVLPAIQLDQPDEVLAGALGESLERYGFAIVERHGIDPALIARAGGMARALFALPEDAKRACFVPGGAGARGYVPFGTERAKGQALHDLKEFWHVGRTLPPGDPLERYMPPNVWPAGIDGFQDVLENLFHQFEAAGRRLLAAIALHLGLPRDWFETAVENGNSVLRLLHYPPVGESAAAARAAPHGDINAITLLLGAEEAGLELLSRGGDWVPVSPPPGAMAVNIGDMLARLTNDRLPSTVHRVRNPVGEAARRSRYSMPFFLHFRPEFLIKTLAQCTDAAHPDRYPQSISADDFLQERLREINLA